METSHQSLDYSCERISLFSFTKVDCLSGLMSIPLLLDLTVPPHADVQSLDAPLSGKLEIAPIRLVSG